MTNSAAKIHLSLLWVKLKKKKEHSFRTFIRNSNSLIFNLNHHKTVKKIQDSILCMLNVKTVIYTGHYITIKVLSFYCMPYSEWIFYEKFRKLQLFEINTIKTKA